jgi:hypothetical protein
MLTTIDEHTLISISIGSVIAAAVVIFPLFLLFIKLGRGLEKLTNELSSLRMWLRKTWTVEHHAAWSSELREKNPDIDLKLPDAYEVARKIRREEEDAA